MNSKKITSIRTAQSYVDEVLGMVPDFLKKGVSEKEVCKKIEQKMCSTKGGEVAFPSIVAFGENAAEPHHEPSDRILKEGDPILIDIGLKLDDYCSDVTRMFCLGNPSAEFLTKYEKVLRIHEAVLSQFTAGKKVTELDQFVRDQLGAEAKYFIHGLGHGVGKEVHEAPKITSIFKKTPPPKVPEVLEEGMVVTCEPGLYYSNKFGIRIEDILVVTNGKPEILSCTSRELQGLKS
jgi:Xaa-Pro aminopeptidase